MVTDNLAFVVFALHMLADFPLQTDWMAANKFDDAGARLIHMLTHFALYFVVLWPVYGYTGAAVASFVAGCHGVIDMRRWVDAKDGFEDYPIWVDQSLHFASIALAVILFA